MPYISVEYLINALSEEEQAQLSDDFSGIEPDAEILQVAVEQASSLVDAHLGVRYSLPLETVPESVKYHTLLLARYILFTRRSYAVPERVEREYQDTMVWLDHIAEGRLILHQLIGRKVGSDAKEGNAFLRDSAVGSFIKRIFP